MFLDCIVTEAEKWILLHPGGYGYYLVVWCRLIHYTFLKPGETITTMNYCHQIYEMIKTKGQILLHDNSRPHVALLTLEKLNELG